MPRINLVIGDTDDAYLEGLVNFIIRNYSHRFLVSSFTKRERLEKYLSDAACGTDILLLGTGLYSGSFEEYGAQCLAVLSEEKEDTGTGGTPVINKYQQGHKLVASILDLYSGKSNSKTINDSLGKNCRIISVASPQGGSGKTCIAVSSCIQCARKGLQVFYLNLEDFNSTSSFFNCTGHPSFSDIIFYLKEKNKNLPLKIEASKAIDPVWGIHFFSPPESDSELNEMTFEDIKELIEKIKALGIYDFIFIDMSGRADAKSLELLGFSDEVILTLNDGTYSKTKFDRFMKAFDRPIQADSGDFKSRLKLVRNRCRQDMTEGMLFESYTNEIDVINIPEIDGFNPAMVSQMAKMDERYVEAIDKMVQKLI